MEDRFEQMIKMNIQGRVFVTCQTHGVTDPAIIGYYVEIIEQAIRALLTDESSPIDFQNVLEEQLKWLEEELARVTDDPPEPPLNGQEMADHEEVAAEALHLPEDKRESGYVPDAKSMLERLKDGRSIMVHLLDNDCITLKLVTPNEAKTLKRGLLGKELEKAEEEVVTALRTVLHSQIRKFIRKHNGGPWANRTLQNELRMDITRTRTLRSLVNLARELLAEREEWLTKNKGTITGRLFGGRVKMEK
jgi:hypothetical protein